MERPTQRCFSPAWVCALIEPKRSLQGALSHGQNMARLAIGKKDDQPDLVRGRLPVGQVRGRKPQWETAGSVRAELL